ncbi:hypothetical protein KDX13_06240 [Burkholderia cenocepacia]|uniref:glycosyl hydrolase family 28-related protein n=1 Tax=Burkholderia cenocepacia TaxID=95486 RepID=UPI001B934B14|nr:glycosyl hydrolase family 28-related protein [Burkholderia cenocepacia]MBR8096308.1 hypothetical protein [Burkholderia cenocepacia]
MSQNGIEVAATPAQLAAGIAQNAAREVFNAGPNFTAGTTTNLTLSGTYGSINNILVLCDATVQTDCTLSGQTLTFNPTIPLGTQQVVVLGWPSRSIGVPANTSVGDAQVAWTGILARCVDSIAQLRQLSKLLYNRAFAMGYYVPADKGGGAYVLVSTSSLGYTDNGGTTIVANDGGVWQLQHTTLISAGQFGAKGDGTTNDTTALQSALNNVKTLYLPQGTYKITAALNVPAGVLIVGEGIAATTIIQYTLTAGGLIFNASGQNGGGVFGITLTSNAPAYNARGSSGVGIMVNQSNQGFTIRDVCISNFDYGLEMNNCFSELVENLIIQYFGSRGIFIPEGAGYTSNDGRYIGIKIHNINNAWGDQSSIGVLIQLSGGHFFTNIDVISTGYGLILQPPSDGPTIAYAQFVECLFDTPYSHAVLIDGTYGTISAIEFNGCWAAYSTAGDGVHVMGSGTNGITWQGGRIRENGFNGVNLVGGLNVQFNGAQISQNSKAATNTYDGVAVQSGVSNWQVLNCQIGNFASGLSTKQRYGVNVQTGSSNNYAVVSNGFVQNQSGGLVDNGTGTNKTVSPNLTY